MELLDYGVCRLAVVPVRKDASDRSEQISQLLFGDHYEVIANSTDGKWIYVRIFADKYEGWIDYKQHHTISADYFEQINNANFKITTDITSGLLYKKSPLSILMGSIVPISNSELFKMEEQFAYNGESKSLGQRRDFEFLRSIAVKYLNSPYQWGGKNPYGIDCSGFVQMVFKICGYFLPRDANQQAGVGVKIEGWENGQPGDLAFFTSKEGNVNHVGILLEENKIIHSSGKVRIDVLQEDGIINLETKIYTHTLYKITRILQGE